MPSGAPSTLRLFEVLMRFKFNPRKTAQAAAHIARRHGGAINYMKLIKLL